MPSSTYFRELVIPFGVHMKNQANQIEFHLHNCLSPKHRYSNKIYLQIFLRRGVAIALQISEMKSFATIAHGVSLLTIVAKSSILDIFGGPGYLSVTLVQNVLTSFFTMYPFDPPEKNMKKRVKIPRRLIRGFNHCS